MLWPFSFFTITSSAVINDGRNYVDDSGGSLNIEGVVPKFR
jgi:hypothetical protein